MFFPNTCDVMAGFLGGRNTNINNSSTNSFAHDSFKANFTTPAVTTSKKDETLTGFPTSLSLTNSCQIVNCPECSKPCSSYTMINAHVRHYSDSNCYSCSVCFARFAALRDLEAHTAANVVIRCCLCQAPFHCKERYDSHINDHKNNTLNHQNVHLQQHQMPISASCDRGQKNTHNFVVDKLALTPSATAPSGFLPSMSQAMSIANSTPNQLPVFPDLSRSQHGTFFVAATPATSYLNQDYGLMINKDTAAKDVYNINAYQMSKFQNKDLLQESFARGNNSNNNAAIENVDSQKKAADMQNISTQEKYANPSMTTDKKTDSSKNFEYQNQSSKNESTMEDVRVENLQKPQNVEGKLSNQSTSFVQFSDSSQVELHNCSLCGKSFKTRVTLSKHTRTVHRVETGPGTDFLDFLSNSMTTARIQQTSPNSAVPGLDKINLLENSSLGDSVFSPVSRDQVSFVGDISEEKKGFDQNGDAENSSTAKKKRGRGRRNNPLGLPATPRYQASRVRYVCDVCDKEFIDKMKHRVHVRTHTGEKPYACDVCGKLFNTRSQVNRHRLHIHELEGKPRNRQYKNRQQGDSTGKSVDTSAANISFDDSLLPSANNSELNNSGSVQDEHNTSAIQAGHNATSVSQDTLANSIVYCYKSGQPVEISEVGGGPHRRRRGLHRIYFCPVCEKPFQDKVKHEVHLRTHTGEKPYSCIVCDKRFNTRSQVNRHMSVHKSIFQNSIENNFSTDGALEGIKSEDVAQEGREFEPSSQDQHPQNESLILDIPLHQISHSANQSNDHQATQTQRASADGSSSVKVVTKKKRNRDWQQHHMCSFCGQNFATPSGLSSHTRNRHKDQIVFNHHLFDAAGNGTGGESNQNKSIDLSKVCSVCGKAFRTANSLRMHMIRHSPIKPHKCLTCERCFITKFESNRCQRRHNKSVKPLESNNFQQEKAVEVAAQTKITTNESIAATQNYASESLTQAGVSMCQRTNTGDELTSVSRQDNVAFPLPVTSNYSELAEQAASNLPVNLSSQETWMQQSYAQTVVQQQQQSQESFMQKAAVAAHYQQMQGAHIPHPQFLHQPIHEQLAQVMSHNMLTHYTMQQDGFQQQQQQQQQQQSQQQTSDQMLNNSKRRRRMMI